MAVKYRSFAWLSALACALLAAAANTLVSYFFGFDLSSVLIIAIVPVGLMALGAFATGGFVLAANSTQLKVNSLDLVYLMLVCSSIVLLVYGCEYLAFQLSSRETFSHFVAERVTKARYLMHARGVPDAPPTSMGEFGWALLVIKTGCMMAIARFGYSLVESDASTWAV